MKLLVLYGTKKGSTAEIADFVATVLRGEGLEVDVANALDFRTDVSIYDAFVFGSPIYTGLWLPHVLQTIDTLIPVIGQKPVYCWVSCIRILEPEGYQHVQQNYMPIEIFSMWRYLPENSISQKWILTNAGHLPFVMTEFLILKT